MRWLSLGLLVLYAMGCASDESAGPPMPVERWGVLEGRVVDAYLGGPIAGATVGLRAGGPRVVTDPEGAFVLDTAPAGEHRLLVRAPGYLEGALVGVEVLADARSTATARLFQATPPLALQERWLDRAAGPAAVPAETQPEVSAAEAVGATRAALTDPTLPTTIRVWRSTGTALVPSARNGWADRSCDGRVEVLDFEEYVKGVIPHEWIPSWDREALRAGAIAARSYAASHALGGGRWECADVDDGTVTQVYADDRSGPTDRAVDDTRGIVVVRDGRVVRTEYSAENGHPTAGHDIDDPVCSGSTLFGHGRGACQWGTQRWATGTCFRGTCNFGSHGAAPKDYAWMMQHYFPGTTLSAGTPAAPCGVIEATGGIVDDGGPCFDAFGPGAYWRTAPAGHGGSTHWTNAFENETPSNWARWNLDLTTRGSYDVEVHIVDAFATYGAARYEVRHGAATTEVVVDQGAAADGWLRLGRFDFAAGGDQSVSLFDNYAGAVGADQHLVADAIRLIGPPPETPPETPTEPGDDATVAPPSPTDDAEMPLPEEQTDGGLSEGPAYPGRPVAGEAAGGCSAAEGSSPRSPSPPNAAWLAAAGFFVVVLRRRRH